MRKSDAIFFLSGAAALIDQVVWARLLTRVIGSDAGGVSTVLAVFMTGLGLGAFAFGRIARGTLRPREVFLVVQTAVALWTAASPFLLELLDPVSGMGARTLIAAALLLPPTFGMGATFPLMGRLTIRETASSGRDTAGFYGANTLGAACGALLAPFVLMPALGLRGALWTGAAFDLTAGILAWRMLDARAPFEALRVGRAPWNRALLVTLLAGFASLALEVLLTRVLISVTGASAYSFALVLAVFLIGMGLGSRQVHEGEHTDARLAKYAVAIAPLTVIGLWLLTLQLGQFPTGTVPNRMPAGAPLWKLWISHGYFALLVLFGPAFCFGALLPMCVDACVRRTDGRAPEAWLAWTYLFNTVGALGGAMVAGFLLLPALGPALGIGVVLLVCITMSFLAPGSRTKPAVLSTVLVLLLAPNLILGMSDVVPRSERGGTIQRSHGAFSSASVEESRGPDDEWVRSLRVNGKVVATSAPVDLRLQRLLGHVPGLLHGEVESALVIGLGTGMTAGSLLDLPKLEELEVFEISSAVREAAREFDAWSGAVQGDPRTHVTLADGRHALSSSDRRFDLITSDPIHPWTRGSSDLYSLEHFENMAAHLAPGGVASQWLPLYQLSERDVKVVIATWCAAFPETSAWLTAYDLALIGSLEPLRSPAELAASTLPPRVAAALREAGVDSASELCALLVADDASLRAYCAGTQPMRDDRPVLEFTAPKSYLSGYSVEALAWAGRSEFVASLPEVSRPRARELRALLMEFLDALSGGLSRAAEEYGASLLEPH